MFLSVAVVVPSVAPLIFATVVAIPEVPLPVTSPERLIVWSPVLLPEKLEPVIVPVTERLPVAPTSVKESRVLLPSVIEITPVLPIAITGAVDERVIGVFEEEVNPPFNAT